MNINSIHRNLWKKLQSEKYRHSFVSSQLGASVSAQLAFTRVARGWTQTELARRADMSQVRISVLEDPSYENFSIKTLKRLAKALDVALIVRFAPFSEMLTWLSNLSPETLAVRKFADDTVPAELEDKPGAIVTAEHGHLGKQEEGKLTAASAASGSGKFSLAAWQPNPMPSLSAMSQPQRAALVGGAPWN